MNSTFKGYLRLTRPANLPTAASDILAGISVGGFFAYWDTVSANGQNLLSVILLVLSSLCLYAGGVVLNDFFDRKLDAVERPERPIPSQVVSPINAAFFGIILLFFGVLIAFTVNALCGILSLALTLSILIYDAVAKHHVFFGPLVMGVCRGVNLLLGMAILGSIDLWFLAFIPMVYIAAITLVSQGEVRGGNTQNIGIAALLYGLVILGILLLGLLNSTNFVQTLPFIALFAFLIFKPLQKSFKQNTPENIRGAVKAGVISLIVMDASLAVVFAPWWVGLLILLLLPLSKYLSGLFAVT